MAHASRIVITVTHIDGTTESTTFDAVDLAVDDRGKRRLRNRIDLRLVNALTTGKAPVARRVSGWSVAFGAPLDAAAPAQAELRDQLATRRQNRRPSRNDAG